MHKITLDLDVLRTFATGVELGSLTKAADRLGRSPSAISAQIKRLEEQSETAIFRKAGRGLILTNAGETLLSYAHRLLDLNDEALVAVKGIAAERWLRIGLQEDFGEKLLPRILGRFASANPKVRIEARIARNAELLNLIANDGLDFALTWDVGFGSSARSHRTPIAATKVKWIGSASANPVPSLVNQPIPIVVYGDNCWFHNVATTALERAGRSWRVALTSPSLGGIWAGVSAGLGVTIRTPLELPAGLKALDEAAYNLPSLGSVSIAIHQKDMKLDPFSERLASIVTEEIRDMSRNTA